MAKLGKIKAEKSTISDADTLVLTDEELENAQVYKTYGSEAGGGGLPNGEYIAEITDFERSVQGGTGVSAGKPKFMVKMKVVEGDCAGRKTPAYFAVASPGQAAQVVRLFDILDAKVGKEINLALLTKSALVGKKVRAVVVTKAAHVYNGKEYPANKEVAIFPAPGSKGVKEKKTKIAK